MRLYESVGYLNNNNNIHANDNIDRLSSASNLNGNTGGNTVKTFTTNGNNQSYTDSVTVTSASSVRNEYFDTVDNSQNWQLETEFTKALSALNETYCFYGSQRKLKSREQLNTEDDNANGNDVNATQQRPKYTADSIDDSSSDIEVEINRLINRSNLCRQNFECESTKTPPNSEEQFMDEEEEFSSLSISASLSTDKPPYPRGIINPNYPGFQHLAHTLSEHFVDHHSNNNTGNMSDSDFSEVESDFPSEGHSSDNNNASISDDSNGNKIIEETNNIKNDNLSTVEEILRTVFESNSSLLTSAIDTFAEKELIDEQTSINEDIYMTDIDACDLKTYLKHYDDNGFNIESVDCLSKKTGSPVDEPDVIKKSNSCEGSFDSVIGKPDILLDVTEGTSPNMLNVEKDEPGSWSITPVDIVGNFEQEVERELDLLVTGYRNNITSDEVDGLKNKSPIEAKISNKITDAVLSNANDTIAKVDVANSVENNGESKNQIPTAIVKPKYQRSSFDERQLPPVAYMNEDRIAWYDKQGNDSNKCSASVATTQSKKIHLPELERKKHTKSMNSAKSAHSNAETAHNNRSNVKDSTENSSDGKDSNCRAVTNRSAVQKSKSSGASVAVVQPRKKERMDERKLMETIVQMQIKKNAQLYKGQVNNKANINPTKANQLNGNMKYFNNNNSVNNNNNEETYANPTLNQAKKDQKDSGCFDVYNIETALPVIDLETIEHHLKSVKEDERRKRNDREEIRRRLAMGAEDDYLTKISAAKPGRKPSLHTRLQEGKNLQICFMNDAAAAADGDSMSSDSESCPKLSKPTTLSQSTNSLARQSNIIQPNPYSSRPLSMKKTVSHDKIRPTALTLQAIQTDEDPKEIDFFTKQARLQIEARMALAQAKDIAHMQMEMERQKQMASPITEMIRSTVEKVGYHFPAEKRRVSRQMLTDMNVAQLQIIVNEFHTQIESLNEQLVKYLMDRDDLHMSQDSMLVDIEDLTRYLGAKKDPYSERKKPAKKFHSMKSPKYLVSQKIQPQHRLASQIGKS